MRYAVHHRREYWETENSRQFGREGSSGDRQDPWFLSEEPCVAPGIELLGKQEGIAGDGRRPRRARGWFGGLPTKSYGVGNNQTGSHLLRRSQTQTNKRPIDDANESLVGSQDRLRADLRFGSGETIERAFVELWLDSGIVLDSAGPHEAEPAITTLGVPVGGFG